MSEQSIFLAALDIADPAQRAAYLNGTCGNDAALRKHIEELIAAEPKLGGFLAEPHMAAEITSDSAPIKERPGTLIGPYKLLQVIGEGGMGVVYMADQETPVRRRVALKIIKPGMDSRQVIARFEAERQALAMMDHQNIARVLDAGTTQSGRPYFVMELVHGVPLTKFCDDSRLTPRERLELFVPVCQAIQHAHQKGVIHRDIKPTNILVTMYDDKPVPKVIDFGVAKAVEQRLTEKTLFTQYGTLVGTFEYMSPEQAEMNAYGVDTRSDIYSLGVLLYELLTGTTPLERQKLREAALVELVRMIKEDEPPRPSIRLSSTSTLPKFAAACRTEPTQLSQLLRGELDWIVMKCLEKDRTRRYETASNLARDVQRYLKDESVEACPPSLSYRVSKFTRRYKAPLAVAAGFLVLLISGVAASTWQAMRATNAEKVAVENEREALKAAEAEKIAKEAEANQRRLAEASEQVAQQQRDAATRAEESAVQQKNNALVAREALRQTLYAAEMNLVQAAWDRKQFNRVDQLLAEQPADLRGFEWHYWERQLQRGRLGAVNIPQLKPINLSRSRALAFGHGTERVAAVLDYANDSTEQEPEGFGLVGVFDVATGNELLPPFDPFPELRKAKRSSMRGLTMSDDGKRLALAWIEPGTIREVSDRPRDRISIRDGSTGSEIQSLESPGLLSEITIAQNGSRLAAVYRESGAAQSPTGVKVWDLSTGELIQTLPLEGYFGAFNRILWSPDGNKLLRHSSVPEASNSNRVTQQRFQVTDVATGEEIWRREILSDGAHLRAWSWSPDGKLLVMAERMRDDATKSKLQLWDSATGATLASLDRLSESAIRRVTLDFSPDGKLLATTSGENEISVWELSKLPLDVGLSPQSVGTQHQTFQTDGAGLRGIFFSADSKTLYGVSETTILAWDVTTRQDIGLGPTVSQFAMLSTGSIAISSDASKVVFNGVLNLSGARDNSYCVWDLVNDQQLFTLKSDRGYSGRPLFRPDGCRVAMFKKASTPDDPSEIVIHDALTGEITNTISLGSLGKLGIDYYYRPDGKQIAGLCAPSERVPSDAASRLVAWGADTQASQFSVALDPANQKNDYFLGYNLDGTSLIVGREYFDDRDGTLSFYDSATGAKQKSISLGRDLHSIEVDLSRKRIIAIGRAAELGQKIALFGRSDVVVLHLETGQELARLRGHNGFDHFAISPDGKRVALARPPRSGRGESEFSIWSLESGRQLLNLKRHGYVDGIAFSGDGHRLVAVLSMTVMSSTRPVQIWDATPWSQDVAK